MDKLSKFYLSADTHARAATICSFEDVGTSIANNIAMQDFKIPLLGKSKSITSDEFIADSGFYKTSIDFYPFLLTNVIYQDTAYYFKHILTNCRFPYSVIIEDSAGNKVDPDKYIVKENNNREYVLYHNLVNAEGYYYFVSYVKVSPDGFINYAYRELLNSNPVFSESSYIEWLAQDPYSYFMSITEDSIDVYVSSPSTMRLDYDNKNLIYFTANFKSDQHWWLSVKNFTYKHPQTGRVFTTSDLYSQEDFYPLRGMNFVIDKGLAIDENNVMFLTSHPVAYSAVEFPIKDLSTNTDLPIRSYDKYSGAVELHPDGFVYTEDELFNVQYFIEQKHIVLDRLSYGLRGESYINFNPVYNQSILGKQVLVYLKKTAARDSIHFATFENKSVGGVNDFYLTSITPVDSDLSSLVNVITIQEFNDNYNVILNSDNTTAVLFLGFVVLHNTKLPLRSYVEDVTDQRQLGGGIAQDYLTEALDYYPESSFYWDIQPHEGDMEPMMTSIIALVPKEVLTSIPKDVMIEKSKKHCPAGSFVSITTLDDSNFLQLA